MLQLHKARKTPPEQVNIQVIVHLSMAAPLRSAPGASQLIK